MHVFPFCFPGRRSPFKVGSTLKDKNVLLDEQILFFESLLHQMNTKLKLTLILFLKLRNFTLNHFKRRIIPLRKLHFRLPNLLYISSGMQGHTEGQGHTQQHTQGILKDEFQLLH